VAIKNKRGLKRVIQNVAGIFAEPTAPPATAPKLQYKTAADIDTLTTGLRPLDKALGIGGLPRGYIVELIGMSDNAINGGTTCIAARIASKVQAQQGIVSIIDLARQFDPWQAERCGLIAPQLLLTQPDTVFNAITSLEQAARNAKLVILMMGVVEKLFNQVEADTLKVLLQRLRAIASGSESTFLIITFSPHNDPFIPQNYPAGFPLSEITAIRLWIQDEGWTRKVGLTTGYTANLAVVKNQFATPGKGAKLKISFTGK